ncbi:tyrosine-protein kinase family protein [Mucilaginibacter sp. UR6-11]|uniref:GumC family protein n=1 Tax=Mucilaginibacter sp. UR6-11 TaxID=1435644 RepID=UPI001E5ED006|nr:tyrosine-protein kinase family protein [Mucilaginibacter sp. UR6-11]MCC8426195.1 polysaccharide biosynthesis tyrosine autokinase [Mucilaginibacter sp. UR6-11]
MCAQKATTHANRRPPLIDDDFDLREILVKYVYYWPVFLLFTIIMMIGAYAYHVVTKPVYDIKATMLLQDDKNSGDIKSSLQDLGMGNAPKKIENDVEILQSRRLVESVVRDLQLWVSYQVLANHLKEDLYKDNSPVLFNLIRGSRDLNQRLTIVILNADKFLLKTSDDPETEGTEYSFSSDVSTSAGTWQLTPTANLRKYIGSTIIINLTDPKVVTDNYQGSLDVALKDKMESSAVDITVKDQIPQRGQDFINYLINLYNKNEIAEKNSKTKSTLDFIDQRLDSLSVELNYAEKQVEQYRSSHGLTDINAQSQVYLQDAQANQGRLNDINVQLKVINDIENYINAPNVTDRAVPSTINIADQNLVALVQSYTDQQRERSRLLGTTPEKNPVFDPINQQIATTRAAIKENINNIKSSLQVTRAELLGFGTKFRSSIESIPGEDRELAALKRLQASKETLYNILLQKREETALSYAATLTNARLVDLAYVLPLKKSKALLPFIAALILGLLIPAGLIYLRETIKNQVTSRRNIEKTLPIPISAELEEVKLKSPIVTDAVNDKINFMSVEQFRSLRTQLHYLHDNENNGRVTLIASSVAGEGRSFVASNLGVALATSGKKTIILELNLYRPIMAEIFNLPGSHPGMSSYLNWESLKEEVIQNTVTYRNLDVITSGQFIPNFSELLDRKRIEILLDWLRLHYDHILIDTSPLQVIGDANIVSRLCDITLYVIRKDFTSKSQIPFINKLYTDQQLPNMSIVFNGVEQVRDGYKDYFVTRG